MKKQNSVLTSNKPTNIHETKSEVNYNSATTKKVEEKTLVLRGNNYYYQQPVNTPESQSSINYNNKGRNKVEDETLLGKHKEGCACLIM